MGALFFDQNDNTTQTQGIQVAGAIGADPSINVSRVVPTGNVNAPRRYGVNACVYLGEPASL